MEGFKNFLADMGARPNAEFTVERIDNNKGYSPENCTWADRHIQARNMSTTRRIAFKGEEKSITTWAEEYGINRSTLAGRLSRGWSMDRAIAA